MIYKVLNENNACKKIDDNALSAFVNNGGEIKREIVQAMGKSHREEYLEYLYPVLNHSQYYMRLDAAQGIFNLNGKKGLQKLKEREVLLDESEFMDLPSEKAILRAMILRIEKGIEEVKKYFLSDEGYEIVKYDIPFCYRSGYDFKEEDVELLCFILENSINKSATWIKKLDRVDYNELMYFTLESIMLSGRETNILKQIDNDLAEKIYRLCSMLIEKRTSSDNKGIIAEISKYMEEEYARKILKVLKNNVKGDARKKYKQSLQYWKIEEETL